MLKGRLEKGGLGNCTGDPVRWQTAAQSGRHDTRGYNPNVQHVYSQTHSIGGCSDGKGEGGSLLCTHQQSWPKPNMHMHG